MIYKEPEMNSKGNPLVLKVILVISKENLVISVGNLLKIILVISKGNPSPF